MSREKYLQHRDQLLMQDEEIAELKAELAELAELRDAMTEVLENVPMAVHYRRLLAALQEKGE